MILKKIILFLFLLYFVVPVFSDAKEIYSEKVIEVHLGCNDSETEADIILSVRKITEDAEISGVNITYKEKTDYCGYKLLQVGRKAKMIYGAHTGYDLWMEIEKYFLIKRSKGNRKIDDLGYPIE